jgi:YD repeat-containing protein
VSPGRKRTGWADLVVKVCLAIVLGAALGHFFLPRYFGHLPPTDRERWLARPKLAPLLALASTSAQEKRSRPCLFLFPSGGVDEPQTSGTVADCLTLVPNGKKMDVLEINLESGELFPVKTDLYVADSMPLAFTRTYCPPDEWSRKFQVHLPQVYDPYLTGSRAPYTYSNWLLPDRQTIHFSRISSGTGYADYIGESKSSDSVFRGSRIAWNGWGWDLALRDGATYLSPEAYNAARPQQGSLTGIFNKDGYQVKLTRAENGDLQEITSPSGQWIRLTYDSPGRIVRATDSAGEHVDYGYDSQDRLQAVHYSNGRSASYTYNTSNQIKAIADTSTGLELSVQYNEHKMPSKVILNGESFEFRYFLDHLDREKGRAMARVEIQKPHGESTHVRVVFTPDGVLVWSAEQAGNGSGGR